MEGVPGIRVLVVVVHAELPQAEHHHHPHQHQADKAEGQRLGVQEATHEASLVV
jgi:hypothetical protein